MDLPGAASGRVEREPPLGGQAVALALGEDARELDAALRQDAAAWTGKALGDLLHEGGAVVATVRALKMNGGVAKGDLAREDVDAVRAEFVDQYELTLANPYMAAERGYVDAVIEPSQTRVEVSRALRHLRSKRSNRAPRKHGNIPL